MKIASTGEIRAEMKKHSPLQVSRGGLDLIHERLLEVMREDVEAAEREAEKMGWLTIGLEEGLSSSKVSSVSRELTCLKVSSSFVEGEKKKLSLLIEELTRNSEKLALKKRNRKITEEELKEVVNKGSKKVSAGEDTVEGMVPLRSVRGPIVNELGPLRKEALETIAYHLSNHLEITLARILRNSKREGRGRNKVTLEDVMNTLDSLHIDYGP